MINRHRVSRMHPCNNVCTDADVRNLEMALKTLVLSIENIVQSLDAGEDKRSVEEALNKAMKLL